MIKSDIMDEIVCEPLNFEFEKQFYCENCHVPCKNHVNVRFSRGDYSHAITIDCEVVGTQEHSFKLSNFSS